MWRAALSRLGQGGACPEVEGLQTFVVLASVGGLLGRGWRVGSSKGWYDNFGKEEGGHGLISKML